MKVFFTASIAGRNTYLANYILIDKTLRGLNLKVDSGRLLDTSTDFYEKEDKNEIKNVYNRLNSLIRDADFLVAEISYPSISVGYQISRALEENKPVITLYVSGNEARALDGATHERLQSIEYSASNLKQSLEKAIKIVNSQIDIRFNFFITPPMIAYMDWLSEKKRIPRSVYLRGLLDKEMRANKDYQKEPNGNGDK